MKAFLIIACVVMLSGCGKEEKAPVDSTPWRGTQEDLSCSSAGGKLIRAFGSQVCPADGYFCILPAEKAPCTIQDASGLKLKGH